MNTKFAFKSEMNTDDAEAVIENPKLSRMGEETPRASRAKGLKAMDENPKPYKGKDHEPISSKTEDERIENESGKLEDVFPDQVEGTSASRKSSKRKSSKRSAKATGAANAEVADSGSYLRLRVQVENGEMSVVDVREVEGPLLMPDTLTSGFAYEVTLGSKRVALGSVPDLGEFRSYPSPKGPPELRGHHVTKLETAEFNVRVPLTEISLAALPETEIALYQVKDPSRDKTFAAEATLDAEFTSEIREVARLKGIKVDALSKDAQKEIRRALK